MSEQSEHGNLVQMLLEPVGELSLERCNFHNNMILREAQVGFFTSACPSFSEAVGPLRPRCSWSGCSSVCIQDPTYP